MTGPREGGMFTHISAVTGGPWGANGYDVNAGSINLRFFSMQEHGERARERAEEFMEAVNAAFSSREKEVEGVWKARLMEMEAAVCALVNNREKAMELIRDGIPVPWLREHQKQIKAEVYEECADIAEHVPWQLPELSPADTKSVGKRIAKAIRSKAKP